MTRLEDPMQSYNEEESMNNEKVEKCETRRREVENMATTKCERFYGIGLEDS